MKATESPLVNLLKGPRQFLIPIYQRAYSWTEEHCEQLWDDVLRVAENDCYPAHFIGSVVYIEHGLYQATAIPQLLVIDGQQRLTTVTLMIEALARALESRGAAASGEITDRKLRNYFLFNPEEDGDLRFKLQLSHGDVDTLRAIVQRKALPEHPAQHLVDNFQFFTEQIEESGVEPEVLYRGLSKLLVVDVTLDRDHDNPQLIFESLNSTGLDLSQSDLIRNFVLMGLEPAQQTELYEDHWRPMESILAQGERDDVFDRFLRAWLTLRLGEVPNIRRGYETFKRYRAMNPENPVAEVVADLHRGAEHYACIALGREEHSQLARAFRGLRALRIDAPMPFLMYAYELWQSNRLQEADMVQIANLMESWLFRRAVCDIPSNVLSRAFATMPGQLDEENLLESLSAYLVLRARRQRFPKDEEFRAAFINRNLYEFKHLKYCLGMLENADRKEPVKIDEFTIEHVMPQNEELSSKWREMLGPDWQEVHERLLHTIGNLTLTGYNAELSDSPFPVKRDMEGGFADSPIRMNRVLGKAKVWDEEAITSRAESLSRKALTIWRAPTVDTDLLKKYRVEKKGRQIPLSDLEHFKMTELTRELFDTFLDAARAIGLEPTIWKSWVGVGKPGAGKPHPIIVFIRKGWLRLQFRVPFADLTDPPAIAYPHERPNGALRTRAEVRKREEVEDCVRILPAIPMLAPEDLDSGVDENGSDES